MGKGGGYLIFQNLQVVLVVALPENPGKFHAHQGNFGSEAQKLVFTGNLTKLGPNQGILRVLSHHPMPKLAHGGVVRWWSRN